MNDASRRYLFSRGGKERILNPHARRESAIKTKTAGRGRIVVTIHCWNCRLNYEIVGVRINTHQGKLAFKFAVCPHCLAPRSVETWEMWKDEDRCFSCHVPFRMLDEKQPRTRFGLRLCVNCWSRADWRTRDSQRKNAGESGTI